jgi:hypothetical protein
MSGSSPGGGAVYVEQTRMHTDTGGDNSMLDEEDLGIDVQGPMGRRKKNNGGSGAGFGTGGIRITAGTIKSSLPMLKINVPLSMSTHDIFDIFTMVSAKEKFQVIEME